jgi:hypothetical protein
MNNSPNPRLTFSPLILALLCCCSAMMFSSCSKKTSNSIIGKWQVQGQKATVEFKSDGTMINSAEGHAPTGKYTFSDDTHMKIEMAMQKALPPGANVPASITVDCVLKINGDDLDIDVTMNIPGETHNKETTHMKRIR